MTTVSATSFTTRLRTWLLLAGLTGLLVGVGGAVGGAGALPIFLGIAILFNLAMYWWSDRLALRMSRARPLPESEDPELHALVRDLAGRAGVPVPRLYLIPQEQPNAFATGRNPSHSAIAVTAGLRRLLPADQLAGVLAHEFAHIRNRDILVQSIGAMIGGAISAIANFLQLSFLFGGGDDEDSPLGLVGALATIILAPIAAMLVQLGISRQREYLADATGARILGRAEPLADALATLHRGAQAIPFGGQPNLATSSLYIVNPFTGGGLAGLFATHPPIEERIRRLRALAL